LPPLKFQPSYVPKYEYVGEADLIFVLIKNIHLVGIVGGIRWYRNAGNRKL